MSAPTFDVATSAGATGVITTKTWAHVNSGNFLIVCLAGDTNSSGGNAVTTLTYGGVGGFVKAWDSGASFEGSCCYYQINPLSGSNTVSVTVSGQYDSGIAESFSFIGVNTGSPVGTIATLTGTASPSTGSISGTASAIDFDWMFWPDSGFHTMVMGSNGAHRTNRSGLITAGSGRAAGSTCDGAIVTMDWTNVNTGTWRWGGFPINGVSAGQILMGQACL